MNEQQACKVFGQKFPTVRENMTFSANPQNVKRNLDSHCVLTPSLLQSSVTVVNHLLVEIKLGRLTANLARPAC